MRFEPGSRFRITRGSLFDSSADILVCPVNCVPGVMGKGLARQFADLFPSIKARHSTSIRTLGLRIGSPCVEAAVGTIRTRAARHRIGESRDICLFPTKNHWRDPSRYAWIFSGLGNLGAILQRSRTDAARIEIAMPALGCGEGGLDWEIVRDMIRVWTHTIPDRYYISLYLPFSR